LQPEESMDERLVSEAYKTEIFGLFSRCRRDGPGVENMPGTCAAAFNPKGLDMREGRPAAAFIRRSKGSASSVPLAWAARHKWRLDWWTCPQVSRCPRFSSVVCCGHL